MILFTDKLQRADSTYPIVDSSDVKGGFFTVDVEAELSLIPTLKLLEGMLAYVKSLKKHYSYDGESWKEAKFGGGGVPLYTNEQLLQLENEGNSPIEYITVPHKNDLNGQISNNTYTTTINGTYVDILFLAIRSLQSEVAKLKNTFYYGIQSYNGTDTASASMVLEEQQEEQEPLWALDPEDLSEFEDYSIFIGSDCELQPLTNVNIKTNHIEIVGLVSLEIDLNFEVAPEAKQCAYIIADTKDGAELSLGLMSEDDELLLSLTPYVSHSKCNILVIINRAIFDEDSTTYVGKNYIWILVTDAQGNVLRTGYLNGNNLQELEFFIEKRYYINSVNFNNIHLYRCNFYSKTSGFTNDDVLSSLTPSEEFTYKAAHITIRSVETKDTLLLLKNRLMENELVLVESEGSLYIKNKNQLISLSSKSTTDNDIMTSEQILNILKDAGYITDNSQLNSAQLNAIETLTFIHSESGLSFNLKINSDGKLLIDQKVPITSDTWPTSAEVEYAKRGAVGHHNLGSFYDKTTKEAPLLIYGNSENPIATGDRVRFGSWYIPKSGLTSFSCSNDFIELANSGSFDYPLENARLFIIKGSIDSKQTGEGASATTSYYLTEATIHKFVLTGTIKAGSTYLIRGAKHSSNKKVVSVDSYDYELRKDGTLFSLEGTVGMVLLNASNTPDVAFAPDRYQVNGKYIQYFTDVFYSTEDAVDFNLVVRKDLIDCVGLGDQALAFRASSNNETGITEALGNKVYNIIEDGIVKDFFELDPSRQGFLSLTTKEFESTGYRLNKINAEYLSLKKHTISFPHSNEEAEIARFTPKASYENKTICTDKTPLNTTKPNMVSCFYGINMQTTRCFNWISAQDQNEYVWIRKKGDTAWNRFESYKGDSSEISTANDSYTTTEMNRVKYTSVVINSVYKRLKGVFPGSNHTYTGHKCVVYIQSAPTGNDPIIYEYIVGATLNNGMPNTDKCSNVQTFTLYPNSWKPKVYHISDQQGFEWTEYLVWAAAASKMLEQINLECNSTTKKFPVLINTGDCTLNGTRYNEWLDYYNAGYCLFDHLEQMNVVGNNDLANAYDHTVLGTGNDEGKSNPYYFHLVNCYEIDNTANYTHNDSATDYIKSWLHPLIFNNVFIPSNFYTYFDTFGYVLLNSELTVDSFKGLYKAVDISGTDTLVYNLYTGYLENERLNTYIDSGHSSYSIKQLISNMLDKVASKNIIVACHEMPFTVITNDNLTDGMEYVDRSCNGEVNSGRASHTSLVGSHMNRVHFGSNWDKDDNYWFSQLLQNKGVKLVLGGHKHSYACTYPIYENTAMMKDLLLYTDKFKNYDISKLFITITDNVGLNTVPVKDALGLPLELNWLYQFRPNTEVYPLLRSNGAYEVEEGVTMKSKAVTYFMVQATGYKLKSNKELPSVNQSFSVIRPKTNSDNTAHYSLESPMFATIELFESNNDFYWGISLYRIINIKTTAAKKITEFSYKNHSNKPMVTERLITAYNEETKFNDNYWYTTNPVSDYQFNYTNVDSDRCWGLDDGKVFIYLSNQINYTQYTLTVKL